MRSVSPTLPAEESAHGDEVAGRRRREALPASERGRRATEHGDLPTRPGRSREP